MDRRGRDRLRVLVICVVLFGAAALFYQFAELVMPARVPMLLLASWSTVEGLAAATRAWPDVAAVPAHAAQCVRIMSSPKASSGGAAREQSN